jgi:hypothetical protein
MFYLHRLLDESLDAAHPDIPLIFGSGILTGIVPSAARGNARRGRPSRASSWTATPATTSRRSSA